MNRSSREAFSLNGRLKGGTATVGAFAAKTMSAAVVVMCLGVVAVGCGGGGGSQSAAAPSRPRHEPSAIVVHGKVPVAELQNDRDDDDQDGEEIGVNPNDSDIDGDNDMARVWNYYDKDDVPLRTFGHAAKGSELDQLVAFATKYSSAEVSEDGKTACAMLTSTLARSVVQDYGHGSVGPAYLRSANTCAQVLTQLFAHQHSQLRSPAQVMVVRAKGQEARVLIGSHDMPASYFELQREGGVWKNAAILAYPLP